MATLDPNSYVLPGLSGLSGALSDLQAQLAASPMTPASPSTQLSYFSPQLNQSIPFSVQDANQYQLRDGATGKVLYSGTGSDAKTALPGLIANLAKQQGDQSQWYVTEGTPSYTNPGGTDWTNIAQQTPVLHDNFNPLIAAALGFGLPLGAALAAPALLGAGAAGAAGGGAAGAGALDALAAAPLSGALGTAGAADLAASIVPSLGAGAASAAGLAGAADLAANIAPSLGGMAGGAAGAGTLAAEAAPEILVSHAPVAASGLGVGSGLGAAGMAALPAIAAAMQPAAADAAAAAPSDATTADITVNAPKPLTPPPPSVSPVLAATAPISVADTINALQQTADATNPSTPSNSTTLDKAIAALKAGAIGSSLLGSAVSGSSGTPYTGLGVGKLSPVFSASLPATTLPGGVAQRTANVMPDQNWYEYGMHPEQSFFNTSAPGYVPQPGHTPHMAHGGGFGVQPRAHAPREQFAVEGPGTGRSDSIPAKLSDGEYVMDAETVALLGDGSSKAGAKKLDQFRVNLRKQKGRNLAQGKFSVNAKSPEAYLAGGRV
jgi:hypothetical protein